MKKGTIAFHTPLIVLLPVLALLSANIHMVPMSQAVRPISVALGASLILWLGFALSLRSVEKGAMGATVFVLVTLIFGFSLRHFGMPFDGAGLVCLWAGSSLGLAVLAALKCPWTKPLNVLAAMTFLVALYQTGSGYARAAAPPPVLAGTASKVVPGKTSRPDIYYIILDAHGSDQALERVFDLPAEHRLGQELEKAGFFVATHSRSNYMQTELSVGSSMNMDYLQKLLPNADPHSEDRNILKALTNNSRLGTSLKQRGYQMIALRETFFPPLEFKQADSSILEDRGMTFIESSLLELTPFGRTEISRTNQAVAHGEAVRGIFHNLKKLAGRAAQPRFIVAHVLCPHPPFVFGPNGEARRQPGPYGLWDGPDYRFYVAPRESYIQGYRDQVQYLDKLVLDAVKTIVAAPGDKVVIIQGDHGSKAGLDAESADKTDLGEVFSILNAYYVPDSIRKRLRPDTAPVNSWRIILNELFGDDLPELPQESYWSPYPYPMKLDRVTDKLKALEAKSAG
jgi:hypothetical protein